MPVPDAITLLVSTKGRNTTPSDLTLSSLDHSTGLYQNTGTAVSVLRFPAISGHPIGANLTSVGADVHCGLVKKEVHDGYPVRSWQLGAHVGTPERLSPTRRKARAFRVEIGSGSVRKWLEIGPMVMPNLKLSELFNLDLANYKMVVYAASNSSYVRFMIFFLGSPDSTVTEFLGI